MEEELGTYIDGWTFLCLQKLPHVYSNIFMAKTQLLIRVYI